MIKLTPIKLAKFLKVLAGDKIQGNVTLACQQINVDPTTVWRKRKKSKSFNKKVEAIIAKWDEVICDVAENKLFSLVNQGHFKAIRYTLDNRRTGRWKQRVAVEGDPEKPIEMKHTISDGLANALADILKRKNDTTNRQPDA